MTFGPTKRVVQVTFWIHYGKTRPRDLVLGAFLAFFLGFEGLIPPTPEKV
jgi:hypothetical protein